MREELKSKLKKAGFNRSCIHYIATRRKLEKVTIDQIKAITEDELYQSWLSMPSVINFIREQNQL